MASASHLERFAFVNERDSDSTISGVIDWQWGLIRVAATGFWSIRQTTDQVVALNAWVGRMHASGMTLSLIADMRRAPAQSQEAAEIVRRRSSETYRIGDRCAVIVPNSIAKLQLRRVLKAEHHEFFVSPGAAETWALAYKPRPFDRADDEWQARDARL